MIRKLLKSKIEINAFIIEIVFIIKIIGNPRDTVHKYTDVKGHPVRSHMHECLLDRLYVPSFSSRHKKRDKKVWLSYAMLLTLP